MNRFIKTLFSVLFLASLISAQEAQVTNVVAAQRTDGSKLVDITYDLTDDPIFTSFTVSVEISFDGGVNFNVTNDVSGDVFSDIISGIGKEIVWDIGEGIFSNQTIVKIIAYAQIMNNTPFEIVVIPAGEYSYGENDELHTIDYDFEIMKYEVTNAQYAEYLVNAFESGDVWISSGNVMGFYPGDENYSSGNYNLYDLGEPSPTYNYGRISWNGTTFIVTEGYGNHPVVHVTWFGAYKFSEYYSLRLPTEDEWEKAARSNTGYDYPWGDNIDSSKANYAYSNDPWEFGTTPIGFYNGQNYEGFQTTDSPSPFGAYDMAGNVTEWTDSWVVGGEFVNRVACGGSYLDVSADLRSWFRRPEGPTSSVYFIGFRCLRILD